MSKKKKVTKKTARKPSSKVTKKPQAKPVVNAGVGTGVHVDEQDASVKFFQEMAESLKAEATRQDKGVHNVSAQNAWKILGIDEKEVFGRDGGGTTVELGDLEAAKKKLRALSEGLGRLVAVGAGVQDQEYDDAGTFHPFDETKYPFIARFKEWVKPFIEGKEKPSEEDRERVRKQINKLEKERVPKNVTKVVRLDEKTGEKTPLFAGTTEKPPVAVEGFYDDDLKQIAAKKRMVTVDPDVLEDIFGLTFTMMDYVVGSDNLSQEQRESFVSEVKRVLAGQFLSQVKH